MNVVLQHGAAMTVDRCVRMRAWLPGVLRRCPIIFTVLHFAVLTLVSCCRVQVERLSGLLQKAQKLLEPPPVNQPRKHPTQQTQQQQEMDPDTLRQTTINSSVNIRQRIIKLFELCENDLYGKLQGSNAQIAVPYRA